MRRWGFVRSSLFMLACLAAGLAFANPARADLEVVETGLNALGAAAEINPDAQGRLWISDYGEGEVWGYYPNGNYFEVYQVGGSPSDARHDGTYLWWADATNNELGRARRTPNTITRWTVPGAQSLYGTALDADGRLWATDFDASFLYRLTTTPTGSGDELCTYDIPEGGKCTYIVRNAGYLWLGDWVNGRLLRLQVSDNSLTSWLLPVGSQPFGMALDGQGNLWYADQGLDVLARFNPTNGALDSYALPPEGGMYLMMVAVEGEKIWYTEQVLGSIGVLNPKDPAAEYTRLTLAPEDPSPTLTGSCAGIVPASGEKLETRTVSSPTWTTGSYDTILYQPGWQGYQMPENSAPWGIASTTSMWYVDTDRQVLGKITAATPCVTPAAVADLGVANASATQVTLSWGAVYGADKYYLWRGDMPYFTPGADCVQPNCIEVMTGTSDTQVVLGDTSVNYAWVVQPVASCGPFRAAPSNRVAEFEFALVKGSN